MALSTCCSATTERERSCESDVACQVDGVAGSKSGESVLSVIDAPVEFRLLLRILGMTVDAVDYLKSFVVLVDSQLVGFIASAQFGSDS